MQRIFAAALCAALLMAGPARAEGVVKLVVPFAPGGGRPGGAAGGAGPVGRAGRDRGCGEPGGAGGTIGANAVAKAAPDGRPRWWRRWATSCPPAPRPTCPMTRAGPDAAVPVRPGPEPAGGAQLAGRVTPAELVKLARVRRAAELWLQRRGLDHAHRRRAVQYRRRRQGHPCALPGRGARADRPDRRSGGHGQCRRAGAAALCEGRTRQGHRHLRHPALAYLPDVPSAQEAGLPALQMSNWYGALAPAATPLATRQRLEQRSPRSSPSPSWRASWPTPASPARWARRTSRPSSTPTWTAGCP